MRHRAIRGHSKAGLGCRPSSGDALPMKEGFVTDGACLTRETWHRGKKNRLRKRRHAYGGKTTAPAAFLEAAKKTQFRPGRPGCRLCCAIKRNGDPADDWL
jgi:hypothetical protein